MARATEHDRILGLAAVRGRLEPVSLGRLSRATLELFRPRADAKNLALALDAQPEELTVAIDADRLRQVLFHLLGAAVKATARGGVTLRTRYDYLSALLSVAVIDTCAGVTPGGPELTTCRDLVETMGGELGVDSRPGEGRRVEFHIFAPLAECSGDAGVPERPICEEVRISAAVGQAAARLG